MDNTHTQTHAQHHRTANASDPLEALALIERTCQRMLRSLRQPRPAPNAGIEAGLALIERAAREAQGKRVEAEPGLRVG